MGSLLDTLLPPGAMDILIARFSGKISVEEAEKRIHVLYGGLNRLQEAKMLAELGKHGRALEMIRALPVELVESVAGQNALADIYYQSGDTEKAMEHCDRALAIRPRDRYALGLKTLMCLYGGRKDEAYDTARAMVEADPDFLPSHFCFGLVLQDRGDYARALEHFTVALSKDPSSVETMKNCGYCLLFMKKTAEAEEYFRQALSLDPLDAECLTMLARLSSGKDSLDEALELARSALRTRPAESAALLVDTIEKSIESKKEEEEGRSSKPSPAAYAKLQQLMNRYFPKGEPFMFGRFSRDAVARYCEKRPEDRCLNFLLHVNKCKQKDLSFMAVYKDLTTPRAFYKLSCKSCTSCMERFMRADEACQKAAFEFKLGNHEKSLRLLMRSIALEDSYRPAFVLLQQCLREFATLNLLDGMKGVLLEEFSSLLDTLLLDVTAPGSFLDCARFLHEHSRMEVALPFFMSWADMFNDDPRQTGIALGKKGEIVAGGCRIPLEDVLEVIEREEAYLERTGTFTLVSKSESGKLLPVLKKMEPLLKKYWASGKSAMVRKKIDELSRV